MTDAMTPRSSFEASDEPYAPSEEVDDALQESSPATQAVGDEPGRGAEVRGGNAGGHSAPRTRAEALEALEYTTAFCRTCPVRLRCREEACAVYRAEDAALAILGDDIPTAAGVPLEWSIV
jgi:hypothetical protein